MLITYPFHCCAFWIACVMKLKRNFSWTVNLIQSSRPRCLLYFGHY